MFFFLINAIKKACEKHMLSKQHVFSHVFFFFLINAIKKACEKHMLSKQHVLLTCQWTHVNLLCGLYEIFYKPVCRKFMLIT
jgi:hypothetical protein